MKIAVLIGGISYEIQRRMLEGIMRYAKEKRVSIDVFTCNGDIYKQSEYGIGEFQIYCLPDFARYDGVIFAKDTIQNEKFANGITKRIKESGIAAVSIESEVCGMPVYRVDNREAMREMVSHLIEVHGVKDIRYLSGPKANRESTERLEGAKEAFEDHGLVLKETDIFYGDYWTDSGREFARLLLKSESTLPEAVVCANDDMALGVYIELYGNGIRVGKDILLTGFDHTSDTDHLTPAITTVEKPQAKIGYEACRSLVEHNTTKERKFQVKCCYRGSCGCTEHRKRNLPEVQFSNIKQKIEVMHMAEMNKNMTSDLNDCDNLGDFCECLKSYIVQLDFSFVYLCLCEEDARTEQTEYVDRIRETYSKRISIPLAYEEGVFKEYAYFAREELLPAECREKIGSETCIVAPLHFRKNCLGYCVMSGSELSLYSKQFQNWIMNISNALESIRKQKELKQLVKRLNHVWMVDSLTGVYNRAGFFHFADRILRECKEKNEPIGMVFADINDLKKVNDTYGHEEGDFYIRTVAKTMDACKEEGQLLMRYGGDEFVILGRAGAGNEFAGLTESLNRKLEECRQQSRKEYRMSVSIGFQSVLITKEFKLDQLMEQADREMYKMKKRKGR